MGEIERDLLASWQLDHIDTLAVVGVVVGPVGGDDYAVSVGEGTATSRVAYNTQHTEHVRSMGWFLEPGTIPGSDSQQSLLDCSSSPSVSGRARPHPV